MKYVLGRPGPNHKLRSADFVLVNKMDLLEHLDFDLEQFLGNLEVANPGVNRILVSARTGMVGLSAYRPRGIRDCLTPQKHSERIGGSAAAIMEFTGRTWTRI